MSSQQRSAPASTTRGNNNNNTIAAAAAAAAESSTRRSTIGQFATPISTSTTNAASTTTLTRNIASSSSSSRKSIVATPLTSSAATSSSSLLRSTPRSILSTPAIGSARNPLFATPLARSATTTAAAAATAQHHQQNQPRSTTTTTTSTTTTSATSSNDAALSNNNDSILDKYWNLSSPSASSSSSSSSPSASSSSSSAKKKKRSTMSSVPLQSATPKRRTSRVGSHNGAEILNESFQSIIENVGAIIRQNISNSSFTLEDTGDGNAASPSSDNNDNDLLLKSEYEFSTKKRRFGEEILVEKDRQIEQERQRCEALEQELRQEKQKTEELKILLGNAERKIEQFQKSEKQKDDLLPAMQKQWEERERRLMSDLHNMEREHHAVVAQVEERWKNRFREEQAKYEEILERVQREHISDTASDRIRYLEAQLVEAEQDRRRALERCKQLERTLQQRTPRTIPAPSPMKSPVAGDTTTTEGEEEQVELLRDKLRRAESRIKSLEAQVASTEDRDVMIRQLRSELAQHEEMERQAKRLQQENASLRQKAKQALILQEEIASLRAHIKSLESLSEEHARLKVQNESLQQQLQEWSSYFSGPDADAELATTTTTNPVVLSSPFVPRSSSTATTTTTPSNQQQQQQQQQQPRSAADVARMVRSLQKDNLVLTEKLGNLNAENKKLQEEARVLRDRITTLERDLQEARASLEQARRIAEMRERSELAIQRERDGLKELLDSYQLEAENALAATSTTTTTTTTTPTTTTTTATAAATTENDSTTQQQQQQQQMMMMMAAMELNQRHLKKRIAQLESNLENRDTELKLLRDSVQQLEKEISERDALIRKMQSERDRMLKERGKLEEELAVYEQRLARGEFNAKTTKVLHLALNPEALLRAEREEKDMDALRTENRVLQARISELEEQKMQRVAATEGIIGESVSAGVVEDLKRQVNDLQTLNVRLKSIFAKKSTEFRQACWLLFGWKLDMPEDHVFRLSSMYAESPEDYLLFRMKEVPVPVPVPVPGPPAAAAAAAAGSSSSSVAATPGGTTTTTTMEMEMLETEYCLRLSDKIKTYLQQCHSIPAFLHSISLDLFSQQTVQ